MEGISSGDVALAIVQGRFIGLVVTDIRMPGLNGLALLEKIKEINPLTEVILITGYGTVESAVTAIKLGAYDYLTKPFDMDKLLKVVENVSEKFSLGEEIRSLKERLQAYAEAPEIVTVSERMQWILELVRKAPQWNWPNRDSRARPNGWSGSLRGRFACGGKAVPPPRKSRFKLPPAVSSSPPPPPPPAAPRPPPGRTPPRNGCIRPAGRRPGGP